MTLESTARAAMLLMISGLLACSSGRYEVVSGPRDWVANPAVVELGPAPVLFAVSDVHGGYDRLAALLARGGVTPGIPTSAGGMRWAAGDAVLVVAGDLFDKGPKGLEVMDALMALEESAASLGGRVVVTLGNHEAEFLADPENDKADSDDGIDAELAAHDIDPMRIANGSDPRGKWLRDRPFATRVGGWFFAHAGNTDGRNVPDLDAALRAAVERNDYADDEIVGGDSILESHDWFEARRGIGAQTAHAVGAEHVVFGHSAHALGPDGEIATAESGALLRIDCGMSPDVGYSEGALLRVRHDAGEDVAESVSAIGSVSEIWRGAAP